MFVTAVITLHSIGFASVSFGDAVPLSAIILGGIIPVLLAGPSYTFPNYELKK